MKKYQTQYFTIQSPISIEECKKRIKESMTGFYIRMFSNKQVVGKINDDSFWISKNNNLYNSFQPILKGMFNDSEIITEITCKVGINSFNKYFHMIWLIGVIIFGGIIFLRSFFSITIHKHSFDENIFIGLFVPIILILFGFFTKWFSCRSFSKESTFLKSFLIHLLEANEKETSNNRVHLTVTDVPASDPTR